ncbi:LVIVD repeat-containing protein [Thalassomonas actiniarum]|uniref:Ig-like domain-containing protein n=1 Tax=Thalassomonas actiniarum TaxID=485447 RepID=A0AAE9YSZ4_9GAMM|nr:hypothetical protein [Thalassomonas actiniarum]WDD99719.1 hypothetical protein SG35_003335 [Thalassomonas actiniarum]
MCKAIKWLLIAGVFPLVGCGGSSTDKEQAKENQPPVIRMSDDQQVDELAEVNLTAQVSDADGNIVSVLWQQTSGPAVSLTAADSENASFSAPRVLLSQGAENLTFSLRATDEDGATTTAAIRVTVNAAALAPSVDAGADANYFTGDSFSLDCSLTQDADGSVLTYSWQQTSGPLAVLDDSEICQPSVTLGDEAGTLEFSLTVTDEDSLSGSDVVTINSLPPVTANVLPDNPTLSMKQIDVEFIDFGWASAIATDERYAYVMISDSNDYQDLDYAYSRLEIFDINEPLNPVKVSVFELPGNGRDIVIDGQYAYVANGYRGLSILDISDVTAPTVVKTIDVTSFGSTRTVIVEGDYAYVGTGNGLKIVDITSPADAVIVAELGINDVTAMQLQDQYLYLADSNIVYDIGGVDFFTPTLKIIDISTPASPQQIASLDIDSYALSVVVAGSHVYLGKRYGGGIDIVDISEPATPVLIKNIEASVSINAMKKQGDTLYVSGSSFKLFDIAAPASPVVIGQFSDLFGNSIANQGVYYYMTHSDGFNVVDFSALAADEYVSKLDLERSNALFFDVLVNNGMAYLYNSTGLKIFDIETPASPELTSELDDFTGLMTIAGEYVYHLLNDMVEVLMLSDSRTPFTVNTLDLSGAESVSQADDYLYLSLGDAGIQVYNNLDPENPVLLSELNGLGYSNQIKVRGQYAYVGGSGLKVLDISAPETPVLVNEISLDGGELIAISGDYAFLRQDTLQIIDISAPLAMTLVGELALADSISAFHIEEDYAYGFDFKRLELYIIDVSQPENMVLSGKMKVGDNFSSSITGYGNKIGSDGQFLYLDDGNALYVVDPKTVTDMLSIDEQYQFADTAAALSYQVSWQTEQIMTVKCQVTGGTCSVTLDKVNKTAEVQWSTPDAVSGHEIAIIGGNSAYYQVVRDQVLVQ